MRHCRFVILASCMVVLSFMIPVSSVRATTAGTASAVPTFSAYLRFECGIFCVSASLDKKDKNCSREYLGSATNKECQKWGYTERTQCQERCVRRPSKILQEQAKRTEEECQWSGIRGSHCDVVVQRRDVIEWATNALKTGKVENADGCPTGATLVVDKKGRATCVCKKGKGKINRNHTVCGGARVNAKGAKEAATKAKEVEEFLRDLLAPEVSQLEEKKQSTAVMSDQQGRAVSQRVTVEMLGLRKLASGDRGCIGSEECPARHQCEMRYDGPNICKPNFGADEAAYQETERRYLMCTSDIRNDCPSGYKCVDAFDKSIFGLRGKVCTSLQRSEGPCPSEPEEEQDSRYKKCSGGDVCVSGYCLKPVEAKPEVAASSVPPPVTLAAYSCTDDAGCRAAALGTTCKEIAGVGRWCVSSQDVTHEISRYRDCIAGRSSACPASDTCVVTSPPSSWTNPTDHFMLSCIRKAQ